MYTVYDSNAEGESKELAQSVPNLSGHLTTYASLTWSDWNQTTAGQVHPVAQQGKYIIN
jgi:hypothetical protein